MRIGNLAEINGGYHCTELRFGALEPDAAKVFFIFARVSAVVTKPIA